MEFPLIKSQGSSRGCPRLTFPKDREGVQHVVWEGNRDGQRELMALLPKRAEAARKSWESNATATLCMWLLLELAVEQASQTY